MTARDILSIHQKERDSFPTFTVDAGMPVFDVIPRLLDSPKRILDVMEGGKQIGHIDQTSLLEGLGRMIASRDDCSVIIIECNPEDYSASVLAHAIEDTDAHLVDLLTTPYEKGKLRVTIRIRNNDPSLAVRSLERYNYKVVEAYSAADTFQTMELDTERLLLLQTLMNV